jgi:hypothetical protein
MISEGSNSDDTSRTALEGRKPEQLAADGLLSRSRAIF